MVKFRLNIKYRFTQHQPDVVSNKAELFPLLSIAVLHGDVHCVRAVRRSLALLVCLLLERSVADPVLDRRGHHTWHAGKSCVLLRVPEHPLQRRLWSVDLYIELSVERFFFFTAVIVILFACPHSSRCCDFC